VVLVSVPSKQTLDPIYDRDLGSKVTKEQHEEIMNRFGIFKCWFIYHYQSNGANNKIFAFHINKVAPKYRDQYPEDNSTEAPGLRVTFLSPTLKAPELAIPSTYSLKSLYT
jgi:hypothetical protein